MEAPYARNGEGIAGTGVAGGGGLQKKVERRGGERRGGESWSFSVLITVHVRL